MASQTSEDFLYCFLLVDTVFLNQYFDPIIFSAFHKSMNQKVLVGLIDGHTSNIVATLRKIKYLQQVLKNNLSLFHKIGFGQIGILKCWVFKIIFFFY